jgi:hypothetical protein
MGEAGGSKQRINKRRHAGAGQEDEHAEDQQRSHQRQQPPFLVLDDQAPELAQKTAAPAFCRGALKFGLFRFGHNGECKHLNTAAGSYERQAASFWAARNCSAQERVGAPAHRARESGTG